MARAWDALRLPGSCSRIIVTLPWPATRSFHACMDACGCRSSWPGSARRARRQSTAIRCRPATRIRCSRPTACPYTLPSRLPPAGGQAVGLSLNWANAANIETAGTDEFTIDGESQDVRLRYEGAIGPRFAWLGELAWRNLSGGSLDHVIEQWHSLFGLPDGSRDNLPRNDLLIDYRRNDTELFRRRPGRVGTCGHSDRARLPGCIVRAQRAGRVADRQAADR